MEFKGTKGKWIYQKGSNCFWVESNLWTIADVTKKSTFEEEEANAKLIAAAPDLLEALQDLKKMYEQLIDCGDCGNWNPREDKEVIKAHNAINKALK